MDDGAMGRRTDGRMGQAAELFFLPLIRDHAGNKGAAGNGAVRAWHGMAGRQAGSSLSSFSLSFMDQTSRIGVLGGGHGIEEEEGKGFSQTPS